MNKEQDAWLTAQPPAAQYLVEETVAFIGCDHQHEGFPSPETCKDQPHENILCLNMNDTFSYACADGERINPEQLDEIVSIYERFGVYGLICWVAKKRNENPVVEILETQPYQTAWKGLYGDETLPPNECNKTTPRW